MPSLQEHMEAQLKEIEHALSNEEAFQKHCEKHREKMKNIAESLKQTILDLGKLPIEKQ